MIKSITLLLDFFLPRFCPACKCKLSISEEIICKTCLGKLSLADNERLDSEFKRKFDDKKIISGFVSLYVFEKDKELQHIIHSIKYDKRFISGLYLGKTMGEILSSVIKNWRPDIIIPVPLHHLKKTERGFNQAYYIAKGLSKETGIPVNQRIIKRIRYTKSQTTLNLKEREENIDGAFAITRRSNMKGKKILLIDDVITTGATISECGKILLEAGAGKIYAASAAIAD
jgi:ComF family protein